MRFHKKDLDRYAYMLPALRYIRDEVNIYFGIQEYSRRSRRKDHVKARQFMFYFAKKYTKLSLASIGLLYNPNDPHDHATVRHCCNAVDTNRHTVINGWVIYPDYVDAYNALGGKINNYFKTYRRMLSRRRLYHTHNIKRVLKVWYGLV